LNFYRQSKWHTRPPLPKCICTSQTILVACIPYDNDKTTGPLITCVIYNDTLANRVLMWLCDNRNAPVLFTDNSATPKIWHLLCDQVTSTCPDSVTTAWDSLDRDSKRFQAHEFGIKCIILTAARLWRHHHWGTLCWPCCPLMRRQWHYKCVLLFCICGRGLIALTYHAGPGTNQERGYIRYDIYKYMFVCLFFFHRVLPARVVKSLLQEKESLATFRSRERRVWVFSTLTPWTTKETRDGQHEKRIEYN